MSPTIVAKDGALFMVTGSPGGRTIINTTLQTILNVVDHGMNAQAAVDAGRIHHQWLPDRISYEAQLFSPDTVKLLEGMGHKTRAQSRQGVAEVIVVNPETGVLRVASTVGPQTRRRWLLAQILGGFGRPPAAGAPDQHGQDVN